MDPPRSLHLPLLHAASALQRINDDLAALADLLEEVHVASETGDQAAVMTKGRTYPETARTIIP